MDGPVYPVLRLGRPQAAAILLAYGLLAFVATLPFGTQTASGLPDNADGVYFAWALGWVCRTLATHPAAVYDANLFSPEKESLLFGEPMLTQGLQALPLCAAGADHVVAYNVTLVTSIALAGFFGFLLAREITGRSSAAFIAGEIFALTTANYDSTARLQIVSSHWTPLVFLFLVLWVRRGRFRDGLFTGLAFAAQSLACSYYEVYLALLLVLTAPMWLRLAVARGYGRRSWLGLGFGVVLAAALVLPVNLAQRDQLGRIASERLGSQSIHLGSFTQTLPTNWLYGRFMGRTTVQYDDTYFPGFLPPLLGAFGLLAWVRQLRHPLNRPSTDGARLLAPIVLMAALAFAFAFGARVLAPWGEAAGPLAVFTGWVPGLAQTRVPSRFLMFTRLGLAVLVAVGAAAMLERLKQHSAMRRAAMIAVLVVLPLEHLSIPLPSWRVPRSAELPDVYRWLTSQSGKPRIVEFPPNAVRLRRAESLWLHTASFHDLPMVNGFSSYYPIWYDFAYDALLDLPQANAFDALRELRVDYVVFHPIPPGTREGDRAIRRFERYVDSPQEDLTFVRAFTDAPALPGLWRILGRERVYRVNPAPLESPRRGTALGRGGWRCESSPLTSGCEKAFDGDPATMFDPGMARGEDQFIRVHFGKTQAVRGLRLDTGIYTRFFDTFEVRLLSSGEWRPVAARLDMKAFIRGALRDPAGSHLDYWFRSVPADGVELCVRPPITGPPRLWRVPELWVYE